MIAIQNSKSGFHPHWVEYCKKNNIPFKLVNCYDNDIIEQLEDCKILFWHHHHNGPKDILIAKQLLYALEHTGFRVFPDFKTGWHFDDKIAQKYLFERIGAPLVPTYLFLDKKEAIDWANKTTFPKILKLRGGAGSVNVKLIKSKKEAFKIINKAFTEGISNDYSLTSFKERLKKYRHGKASLKDVFMGFGRLIIKPNYLKVKTNEFGYVYFQDFIDGNDSDIRIIVINNKAFALKRFVRENDFRASGSGNFAFEKENFDDRTLKLAFETAKKLKAQCVAFDFIFLKNNPVIVEISYGFNVPIYDNCQGFWDENLNWYEGSFNPYGWMIENIIDKE